MQNEYKVMRLQLQAIISNISYLVEELSTDEIVPQLIKRRLLTEAEGEKVLGVGSQLEKVYKIVQELRCVTLYLVGTLPTLSAALLSARQPHVAERLHNSEFLSVSHLSRSIHQTLPEFQSLLKGERASHQQEEDEVMISRESSAQPSPPPPDSHLVTAELEDSTLTRAQYNTICSLTSSLLHIPTGDLVYDGHTLNPLTLHWHCSSLNEMFHSLSLYTEMVQTGIRKIQTPVTGEIIIPQLKVSVIWYSFYYSACILQQQTFITLPIQEMDLVNTAYDGDVNFINCALGAKVPVDIVTPVRDFSSCLRTNYLMYCVLLGWEKFTDVGISEWTCGGRGHIITTWSNSRPAKHCM